MSPLLEGGTLDRREQLVEEIADALATSGKYVQDLHASPAQHLVDLHWCAHLAGRRLGMKVRVIVAEPSVIRRADHDEEVTMTVVPRPAGSPFRLP